MIAAAAVFFVQFFIFVEYNTNNRIGERDREKKKKKRK